MTIKHYFSAVLIAVSLAVITTPADAALDLELTQGMNAAIPIAIIPFDGPKVTVPGNETLTQVIKDDLQNSGQFRVTGPDSLDQTPKNLSEVNYGYWRKQGVNDLVIGAIHPLGGNQYEVAFSLVSVFANANHANADNIITSQSFRIEANNMRDLAHHISDMIYQALTGVRGIFSTKIAYVLVQRAADMSAKYTLEVADADGFNPRPLLVSNEPIMSPTWSPNGEKIAYVSFEGHRAAIYTQDLATGRRELISDAPGINNAPAFSPDGRQLALVLTKNGNPNIYLLNLGSHSLQEVTSDPYIDTEPAFSADGKSLLFTSSRYGSPQIFQYVFASGKVSRVTYQGDYNARADFLPDDQGFVLMHRDRGLFGIARVSLATGQLQVLAQGGADESPSLAPNGKMIIYATQQGGRGVLAQVSIDGRVKLRLPAREGSVQEPAWSPFLNS
jgi:TolB protein